MYKVQVVRMLIVQKSDVKTEQKRIRSKSKKKHNFRNQHISSSIIPTTTQIRVSDHAKIEPIESNVFCIQRRIPLAFIHFIILTTRASLFHLLGSTIVPGFVDDATFILVNKNDICKW